MKTQQFCCLHAQNYGNLIHKHTTSATLVGNFFFCVCLCVCVKIFSTGLSVVSREVADAAVAHSESGVNVLVSVWLMIGLKKSV